MDRTAEQEVDVHTRLLRTGWGRAAIGVIVAVGAFWIVAPNLPPSAVRSDLATWWSPADDIGLAQDWSVFSPNPRSESFDVRARITRDDGTIEFWDVPEYDPGLGAYRQYRWHKWQERIRADDAEWLWLPTAEWIADRYLRDGVRPRQVVLIRRWVVHGPLTDDGRTDDSGWNEYEFFVWERDA